MGWPDYIQGTRNPRGGTGPDARDEDGRDQRDRHIGVRKGRPTGSREISDGKISGNAVTFYFASRMSDIPRMDFTGEARWGRFKAGDQGQERGHWAGMELRRRAA